MDSHNIVLLFQCGRLTCSSNKELEIEMRTAYHLEVLHRDFHLQSFMKISLKSRQNALRCQS